MCVCVCVCVHVKYLPVVSPVTHGAAKLDTTVDYCVDIDSDTLSGACERLLYCTRDWRDYHYEEKDD